MAEEGGCAVLYYFDARGMGELPRLMLAAAGITFQERHIMRRADMEELINSDKLLFHEVPLLTIDGRDLVQANAIVRYIARKVGMLGQTEDEMASVDEYYEGGRDFYRPFLRFLSGGDDIISTTQKFTLPRYLGIFEKILADSESGYLLGNTCTMADLSLLEPLLCSVDYYGNEVFDEYPNVEVFFKKMTSNERIKAYLEGPQRFPATTNSMIGLQQRILDCCPNLRRIVTANISK